MGKALHWPGLAAACVAALQLPCPAAAAVALDASPPPRVEYILAIHGPVLEGLRPAGSALDGKGSGTSVVPNGDLDPNLAWALDAIWPGTGQIYAGEFDIDTATALFFGGALTALLVLPEHDQVDPASATFPVAFLAITNTVIRWAAIHDGQQAVKRANARRSQPPAGAGSSAPRAPER